MKRSLVRDRLSSEIVGCEVRHDVGYGGMRWITCMPAAMRERSQELKAAARRGPRAGKADGESDLLSKIAEMPEPDRAMAERLHAIIKASAPALSPRTWYGMPAY